MHIISLVLITAGLFAHTFTHAGAFSKETVINGVNQGLGLLDTNIATLKKHQSTITDIEKQLDDFNATIQKEALTPLTQGKLDIAANKAGIDKLKNSELKMLRMAYQAGLGITIGSSFLSIVNFYAIGAAAYMGILTAHLDVLIHQFDGIIPTIEGVLGNADSLINLGIDQIQKIAALMKPVLIPTQAQAAYQKSIADQQAQLKAIQKELADKRKTLTTQLGFGKKGNSSAPVQGPTKAIADIDSTVPQAPSLNAQAKPGSIDYAKSPHIYKAINDATTAMSATITKMEALRATLAATLGSKEFSDSFNIPLPATVTPIALINNEGAQYANAALKNATSDLVITKQIWTDLERGDIDALAKKITNDPLIIEKALHEIGICMERYQPTIAGILNKIALVTVAKNNAGSSLITYSPALVSAFAEKFTTVTVDAPTQAAFKQYGPLIPIVYKALAKDPSMIAVKRDLALLYYSIGVTVYNAIFTEFKRKEDVQSLATILDNVKNGKPFTIEPYFSALCTIAQKSVPLLIQVPAILQSLQHNATDILVTQRTLIPSGEVRTRLDAMANKQEAKP